MFVKKSEAEQFVPFACMWKGAVWWGSVSASPIGRTASQDDQHSGLLTSAGEFALFMEGHGRGLDPHHSSAASQLCVVQLTGLVIQSIPVIGSYGRHEPVRRS